MIWDVALTRQLRQGDARFTLDVRFASDAQRLVLYGPSGSGKTQTLRMIAGIAQPDGGRIVLAGRTLFDAAAHVGLSPQQRHLGTMFQDYALFPHLNVRQNIAFGLRRGWRNPRPGERLPEVERWIATFGLQAVADLHPAQISGGQRQRTALARALVTQPSALLLDEPFAALDKPLRQRLRRELADLQAELGLPLLLITHDDDDVAELGQHVVHLEAGRVVERPAPGLGGAAACA